MVAKAVSRQTVSTVKVHLARVEFPLHAAEVTTSGATAHSTEAETNQKRVRSVTQEQSRISFEAPQKNLAMCVLGTPTGQVTAILPTRIEGMSEYVRMYMLGPSQLAIGEQTSLCPKYSQELGSRYKRVGTSSIGTASPHALRAHVVTKFGLVLGSAT